MHLPPLLRCVIYVSFARLCWGEERRSKSGGRQRLKVHSPDEILELSADGAVVDARFPDIDRPVMRREHREAHQAVQADASLATVDNEKASEEMEDLVEAQKVAHSRAKQSVGFAEDMLEELLHTVEHTARQGAPNIVKNSDFEESSSWNKDCPNANYRGHADVTGSSCSTRGFWSGAAHGGTNTSGNVWSIKSLTDCFKNTRGAVYQDITTTAGTTYELDFYSIDAFLDKKSSNESSRLHVEVQSPAGTSVLDEATILSGSAYQPAEGTWSLAGPFKFKAASENTRIYFYAGGTACPMIDNVGVRATEAASETTQAVQTTQAQAETTSEAATTMATTTTAKPTTQATTATTAAPTTTTTTASSTTAAAPAPAQPTPSPAPAPTPSPASPASTPAPPTWSEDDDALLAGATAAASARAQGLQVAEQALAAGHAAHASAKAEGESVEKQTMVAAKAAAQAVVAVGGTPSTQCAEAGRAAFYVTKTAGMAQGQTAAAAGDAAVEAVKGQGLGSSQLVECVAVAVKTACKEAGLSADLQSECAGAAAISAAQKAGMSEEDQADAAGRAVEAVLSMTNATTMDAWQRAAAPAPATTTNPISPQIQELLKEVQEAKKAAQEAALAASKAQLEALKAQATAKTTTEKVTTTVPAGADFETEVYVTEKPQTTVEPAHPFGTTTQMRTRPACPDSTRAPRGTWVVYNLSATPILHSCLVKPLKGRVPDACCQAPGAINAVGATFEELYYTNDYGSCVTLTYAGPLAGEKVKLQCNSDNTITYGEERCGEDCSCSFQDVYAPGCYRSNDALPGTAWFFLTAGCDCVEQKAVQPHQFNLPPLDQNVGAADILNVGPEEAARALNRQRQQLRAYADEMMKEERVMTDVVNRLSSGKPIADAIFGMDTGEIPEKVTKRMLAAATQDAASAKYAINATVSIMGHALSTLKSGKPLADAVFGGDTSHLVQPHLPPRMEGSRPGSLALPKSRFRGRFPDLKGKDEPVETVRFSGDFQSLIGDNVEQFLAECSAKLKPVSCADAKPGSVVVTLVAESWEELEEANKVIASDFELPSFGKFEKEPKWKDEKAKDTMKDAAEMTPEEKKKNLLNPDITAEDQKIVQSIFDAVHDDEAKKAEQGEESAKAALRAPPTAEEQSTSNAIVGICLTVLGFGCIGLCIYSWVKAAKKVKAKLTTAAQKRLMKRAQKGDTLLVVTGVEGLQVGEEVMIGKEKVAVQGLSLSVVLSAALAADCPTGAKVLRGEQEVGSLSEGAVAGAKELRLSGTPALKKGDKLKLGEAEIQVKSTKKQLLVSPALSSAHIVGTKLRKPGEPDVAADEAEGEDNEAGEATEAEVTEAEASEAEA
eukprot:CAMPEP_0181535754 /NCGR_PEP_ID=MMETSP1110-20121109/74431_1 /TAXON_ID=174948 /ORGANISM="Symbiodinium sp., Strain CCMP421" /LENGTH=1348 /DNA_ID=CAMNT_0023667169 /DNA_START=160 /DNA_END=4202 /DNA_ORIENTATION=+